MKRKHDLDVIVAALLGRKERDVSEVTAAFITEIRRHLVQEGEVLMDALGRLHLVIHEHKPRTVKLRQGNFKKGVRGPEAVVVFTRQHKVHFSKAHPLERDIHEHEARLKEEADAPRKRRRDGQVRGGGERGSGRAREGGK